jgi:hypothetical protein
MPPASKRLLTHLREVFGADQPVQRCLNHKLRNVLNELPKEEPPKKGRNRWSNWRGLSSAIAIRRRDLAAHPRPRFPAQVPGHHQHHRESLGGSNAASTT